jgi:hypothetical protein
MHSASGGTVMVNYMDSFVTNCAGGLSGGGAGDFFRYRTAPGVVLLSLL